MITNINEEERFSYFEEKYKGRVKFAGAQNPLIKHVTSLINNSKPNPKKLFAVEGIWGLQKALDYNLHIETFVFAPECIHTNEAEEIINSLIEKSEDSYILSKKVFLKISEREGPDGLLALCYLPQHNLSDIPLKENNLVVILDGLEIPGNIGTIIRSVDGVAADGVILCNRKARLTHPKLIKSSQGSNFTVIVVDEEYENVIKYLKENNFQIFLTDTRAEKSYFQYDYKGRVALIAGSERYGISREWYKEQVNLVSIPMFGDCDSLNVAIATTIFLYEASLKQKRILLR